jgi:hypothetical protein
MHLPDLRGEFFTGGGIVESVRLTDDTKAYGCGVWGGFALRILLPEDAIMHKASKLSLEGHLPNCRLLRNSALAVSGVRLRH